MSFFPSSKSFLMLSWQNRSNVETIEMRSKVLSLELLHSIFENSTPAMKSNERFINNAIKKHLIMALLMNGGSASSAVLHPTLAIFFTLVREFREYLKVWFTVIFCVLVNI